MSELAGSTRCPNHLHSQNSTIPSFQQQVRSLLNMCFVEETLGANHLNHHLRLRRNNHRVWLQKTFLIINNAVSPSYLGITNGDQHAFAQKNRIQNLTDENIAALGEIYISQR